MLKITLCKSPIGYSERQKLTAKALGLTRMNATSVKPDNPQTRGMVRKISHLVQVEKMQKADAGGNESETQ